MAPEPLSDHKPNGYWKDKANVVAETLAAAGRLGHPTLMPSGTELRQLGLSSLEIAITKNFGGLPRFAKECGLQPRRLPNGFFDEMDTLCKALRVFATANGTPNLMPTTDVLRKAREHSLIAAIAKHDGVEAVSTASRSLATTSSGRCFFRRLVVIESLLALRAVDLHIAWTRISKAGQACHDEAWGCAYSRVWRAYLDVIRDVA